MKLSFHSTDFLDETASRLLCGNRVVTLRWWHHPVWASAQPPWVALLPSGCQFSWLTNKLALKEPVVLSSTYPPLVLEVTWGNTLLSNSFAREKKKTKTKDRHNQMKIENMLPHLRNVCLCRQTKALKQFLKWNWNLVTAKRIFLQWSAGNLTFHTTDIRNCGSSRERRWTGMQKLLSVKDLLCFVPETQCIFCMGVKFAVAVLMKVPPYLLAKTHHCSLWCHKRSFLLSDLSVLNQFFLSHSVTRCMLQLCSFNKMHETVESRLHPKMWSWLEIFSCEVDPDVHAGPGAGGRHQTLAGHAAERAGLDGRNHQGGCQSKGLELNAVHRVTNTTRWQIRLAIWKEFNYFAPSFPFPSGFDWSLHRDWRTR